MIQKIVGISFNPIKDPTIQQGTDVEIIHNKDNQYSSRAIAVMYQGKCLGHIGEKNNEAHAQVFESLPLKGKVCTISVLQEGEEFQKFKAGEITHIEVEFPMSTDSDGKIKSFNEDVSLTFDPALHRYVHNGKELVSATTYIQRWMKEFDAQKIAPMCANKYGVSTQEVLDYWEGNGDVASIFGTAIHNALEHFEKFKKIGAIVQAQKDLPFNKALPSHPALRKIVEDFYKLDLQKGEVLTEVLLTNVEKGLCGYADRILVTGEKRCRVQDYKVNIGSEELDANNVYLGQMAVLPKNKISKYQMQMSFYARLLELSGWTVEGMDVFVYEDTWKQFDLPVLKLDF